MDQLLAGRLDQEQEVTTSTNQKQLGILNKWKLYLERCQIQSPFLDNFTYDERISLLSGFTSAVRRNLFGPTKKPILAGCTVKAALNNLCSAFRANLRPNPVLEASGERSLALTRQIRSYIQADPATKHQKCLPKEVFEKLYNNRSTPIIEAMGELLSIALFFGMRSCEYVAVTGSQKTKLLYLADVRFFHHKQEINRITQLPSLTPTTVTVTFMRQ